jgi:hypothetical protein
MLTLGWVVFDEGQRSSYAHCAFDTLTFFKSGPEPFAITPPLLTTTELREISRCDQDGKYRKLDDLPLPPSEVEKFHKLRRYWPLTSFAEMT